MFPEIPEDLSALTDDELAELHNQLVAAFNEATAEGAVITSDDLATFTGVTEGIEAIRSEQGTRAEAAAELQAQLSTLTERVNFSAEPEAGEEADAETPAEGEQPTEGESPEQEAEPETPADPEPDQEAEPVTAATKPAVRTSVTAGATVATLQRNAPARTQPREEAPTENLSILTASAEFGGVSAGAELPSLRKVAELMIQRQRRLGTGNDDDVQIARFELNLPDDRRIDMSTMSLEQQTERINSFSRDPQSITAAGGLCAPVNNYYEQYVISDSARPVRDALANFQADRGGIRYNPPPTLASLTSGIGTVTAAQDASNTTKGVFTVTCPSIVEVDVAAVYNQLQFGNFGARAFPEQVEAWIKLALAAQAREAEKLLLDGIAAASTSVTSAGLVGAGRELFVRLAQAAANMRSRHRMSPTALIDVLLPAWTLDLVQADFARTFTDATGFISMNKSDIEKLFGDRNLNVGWYLDSKTGGGQILGAADSGRSVTDGATNTNTTVTSATAAFTSADIGKSISGTGIPAGATITAVASGTSVTISAAATATATGVTLRIGAHVLANYPTTVYAYVYPTGSFLHLDAGTLDLGLVRDSTLNSGNNFRMFTENFENVALIGPESLEVVLSLSPDGSSAAAKSVTGPFIS